MPTYKKKEIDFKCDGCGNEFSSKKYWSKKKSGEFICYKKSCPECGNSAESTIDEEKDGKGRSAKMKRSPSMDERDFSSLNVMPAYFNENHEEDESDENVESEESHEEEDDVLKPSGVRVLRDNTAIVEYDN